MFALFVGLLAACDKRKEVFPTLKVESSSVAIYLGETVEIKILAGSQKYKVESKDEQVAKALISDNGVIIEAVSVGHTAVKVTDVSSQQSVMIEVNVTDEKTLLPVASKVIELKQVIPHHRVKDLPENLLKEYWGERITDNTPTELRFMGDELYIVKPNGLIEKYKIEWRGNELYLNSPNSDAWQYCGVRDFEKRQFILNTGFYKGESKNDVRTLRFTKQSYSYKSLSEFNFDPSATILWVRMSFVFEEQ